MNINKDTRLEVVKMIISSQELSKQEELMAEYMPSGSHRHSHDADTAELDVDSLRALAPIPASLPI